MRDIVKEFMWKGVLDSEKHRYVLTTIHLQKTYRIKEALASKKNMGAKKPKPSLKLPNPFKRKKKLSKAF
jgi:hypothetical protein